MKYTKIAYEKLPLSDKQGYWHSIECYKGDTLVYGVGSHKLTPEIKKYIQLSKELKKQRKAK